jgi:transposase
MPRIGTTEELERKRMLAANMFEQGLTSKQIAVILECDDQTVRRWRRVWKRLGREGLRGSKPPGASPKLDARRRAELVDDLKRAPSDHGLDAWLWTTKLVAAHIKNRFGVEHHHDHVGVMLHALGLSWQRPIRRARERDEAAITQWRERTWPTLEKKRARPAGSSSSPTRSDS